MADNDKSKNDAVPESIFDEILSEKLGDFGLFQKALIFLLAIPACCLTAYGTSDLVFLAYTPKHVCAMEPFADENQPILNESDSLEKCDFYNEQNGTKIQCEKWLYDKKYFDETLTTKWNLVCDRAVIIRSMVGE